MIEQVNTNTQQLLIYLSQEPLTVKHLEEFKSLLTAGTGAKSKPAIEKSENQETKQQSNKDFEDQIQNIKAKAEMGIAEAKNIFGQFVKTGKKSVGRGIYFEQAVIDMYEGHFDRLKIKF